MFSFLDSFTSICGGDIKDPTSPAAVSAPVAPTTVPENDPPPLQVKEQETKNEDAPNALDHVDPMDTKNYLVVQLTRPMGILFEENHIKQHGGAFIAKINEGCSAAADGSICSGDQLVAVGEKRVSGMDFGEVIKIIEGSDINIKLTLFRGPAESLYGPSGASIEWLDEFVAERGEEAVKAEMFDAVTAAVHDAVDEMGKADQPLTDDVKTNVEKEEAEPDKEMKSEAVPPESEVAETAVVLEGVQNEVDASEEGVGEGDLEKGTDAAREAGHIEANNDVETDDKVECKSEKETDASEEECLVVYEKEVSAYETGPDKDYEASTEVESATVVNDAEEEEEVACDDPAGQKNEAVPREENEVVDEDGEVADGTDGVNMKEKVEESAVVKVTPGDVSNGINVTEEEISESETLKPSVELVPELNGADATTSKAELEHHAAETEEALATVENEDKADGNDQTEADTDAEVALEDGAEVTKEVSVIDNEVVPEGGTGCKGDPENEDDVSDEDVVIVNKDDSSDEVVLVEDDAEGDTTVGEEIGNAGNAAVEESLCSMGDELMNLD